MVHAVEPKFFLLAETRIMPIQIENMLVEIGASKDWTTDAPSGGEYVAEVAGRLCYKSFEAGLNPNVTRVRSGNADYLGNILSSGHGSVLEHASTTVAFTGVSRVFTHEFVRHRHGSPSQESMRFVRLEDMPVWFPAELQNTELYSVETVTEAKGIFEQAFLEAEAAYGKLVKLFGIDKMKNFADKKRLTSAFRRIAPDGIATNVAYTANHRAWRHIIEVRTSVHAEEEVRLIVGQVANHFRRRYPNFYQDMNEVMLSKEEDPLQLPTYVFTNKKV